MNISQFNSSEKKTRIGYKDKQKKEAFSKMNHVGDALCLHDAVVQRAKELFAGFRDDRELVQQFKGVVAACICEAFHQLSSDGRRILKQRVVGVDEEDKEEVLTKRATWRSDMHKSTAAQHENLVVKDNSTPDAGTVENKPAPSWTIDDCRSFLLESSKKIAQQWSTTNNTVNPISKSPYPNKDQSELEGMMIEYTLKMCDYLEKQVTENSAKNNINETHTKIRVATPRVNDMKKLSLTLQHSDPVRMNLTIKSSQNKSAGQVLILLTSKKWGMLVGDKIAGEAFHKELRTLLAKQESQKTKQRHMELAQQRFKQLKRKPWLQARANEK